MQTRHHQDSLLESGMKTLRKVIGGAISLAGAVVIVAQHF
jgi:hypothetical protein